MTKKGDESSRSESPMDQVSPIPTVFPSGRQLSLRVSKRGESLELKSPAGNVELSIDLTEEGPVLRLHGARLLIDSTESVALNCREFEVNTTDGVQINAGGTVGVKTEAEIRMKSAEQTFIDGDYVNLNCLERTGYHDEGLTEAEATQLPETAESMQSREVANLEDAPPKKSPTDPPEDS